MSNLIRSTHNTIYFIVAFLLAYFIFANTFISHIMTIGILVFAVKLFIEAFKEYMDVETTTYDEEEIEKDENFEEE